MTETGAIALLTWLLRHPATLKQALDNANKELDVESALAQVGYRRVARETVWPNCRVFWGTHGCKLARGHEGAHDCQCCDPRECKDGQHYDGCVATAPYYGSGTWFYGEDASND